MASPTTDRPPLPLSSLAALPHRNFRLLWIGQLVSISGSMMQRAAILWHVSLLVPPGRKGLALGDGGPGARGADRRLLAAQRRRRRRARPPPADARHPDRDDRSSPARSPGSPSRGARRAVAGLPARRRSPRPRPRLRRPGAPVARSRRSCRASTCRTRSASTRSCSRSASVLGPVARRARDRDARRRAGSTRSTRVSFLAVHRRARCACATCRGAGAERAPTISLEAARRGAALRVRRAAHPLDHAARLLRDLLLVGDGAAADLRAGHPAGRRRSGYGWLYAAPVGRGGGRERCSWCGSSTGSSAAGAVLLWAVAVYGLATVGVRLLARLLAHVPLPRASPARPTR